MKKSPESLRDGRRAGWRYLLLAIAAGLLLLDNRDVLRALLGHAAVLAGKLPSAGLLLACVLLPMAGFPVSVLYFAAGLRWGGAGAMVLIMGAIAAHLTVAHLLAGWLREPLARWVGGRAKFAQDLVAGANAWFVFLAALLPAVPYAFKNYGLALAVPRWRPYLLGAFPAHLFTALPAVFIGEVVALPRAPKIAAIAGYVGVLLTAGWFFRHRRKMEAINSAAL
ncbi:MAG: hypothetical protein JF599_00840 [Verrucomicrobia bacterium]|nr:hypothetical protein [Verrucomicrobiota bacterium]